MAIADLITSNFATSALAAGGMSLTTAQTAHLASAITAASQLVRRWCGDRDFTRTTYTKEFTPSLDGVVALDQMPVNAVTRIAGGRTTALSIAASPATNQRATVAFSMTGDYDAGQVVTGLLLSRVASGTTTTSPLLFATYTTLTTLAAAVNLLSTWSCTIGGGLDAWPSSELVGGETAKGALSGASLDLYAEDLDGRLDRETGLLYTGCNTVTSAWGFFPDYDAFSAGRGRVKVTYDAGYDTVPLVVQEATAEAVADMLRGLGTDGRLSSETVGNRSKVFNTVFSDYALPKSVQGKLAPYRMIRA